MKSLLRLLPVCLLILTPSLALAQWAADYSIELYEGTNYSGKNVTFNIGVNDHYTEDFRIPGGGEYIGTDKISSIKVGRGLRVTFYGRRHMLGGQGLVLFRGNTPRLLHWDDQIASIKYERIDQKDIDQPWAEFFQKTGGYDNNPVQSLGIGFYRAKDGNFLEDNDFAMFSCQKGIIVRVFEDDDDSNKPGDGGVIISHPDVFRTGRSMVSLVDFGLKDKISAISIEPAGYKITKTELVSDGQPNPVRTKLDGQDTSGILVVKNASPFPLKSKMQLSQTFTETIQRSWSNATLAGIEATASVSVTGGVPGGPSATASASLSAKLENTFTIGNDKSEGVEQQVTFDAEQEVPSGKSVRIIGVITPEQLVYRYKYTWEANNGSASAPIRTTTDTVTMKLKGSATTRSEGAGDVPIVTGVTELEVIKTDK